VLINKKASYSHKKSIGKRLGKKRGKEFLRKILLKIYARWQILFDNDENNHNQKAAALLEEASQKGNSKATLGLAKMYEKGEGVKKDEEKAFKLVEQEFASKVIYAGKYFQLFKIEKRFVSCPSEENAQKALELLEKSLTLVLTDFADLFKKFNHYERAVTLYKGIAKMHKKGEGIEKNEQKAAVMYKHLKK
jgi:TPR repeat protein